MSFNDKDDRAIAPKVILPTEFCMYLPSGEAWAVQSTRLSLIKQESQITECRLTCQIDWNTYQSIKSQGLFRYDVDDDVDIIENKVSREFAPEFPLNLTLLLSPEWLSLLEDKAGTDEQAIAYLQSLNHEIPTSLLLSTDNWLVLFIQQQQLQGEVKYRTFWDYLDWQAIAKNNLSEDNEKFLWGGMVDFFKDSVTGQLLAETSNGEIDSQAIQSSLQLVETLFDIAPSLIAEESGAKQQFVDAIANVFQETLRSNLSAQLEKLLTEEQIFEPASFLDQFLTEGDPKSELNQIENPSIFQKLIYFFKEQNWTVYQLPEQSVLHFEFEGQQGEWNCYAQAREDQQQFIFYSILPMPAPQERNQAIAEFLTRANYGLILGNFELDFEDGEIRYKTSIDVQNSQLDLGLIHQLIYSNLLTTDKYLPGIVQVIDGITPKEAIAHIENQHTP